MFNKNYKLISTFIFVFLFTQWIPTTFSKAKEEKSINNSENINLDVSVNHESEKKSNILYIAPFLFGLLSLFLLGRVFLKMSKIKSDIFLNNTRDEAEENYNTIKKLSRELASDRMDNAHPINLEKHRLLKELVKKYLKVDSNEHTNEVQQLAKEIFKRHKNTEENH